MKLRIKHMTAIILATVLLSTVITSNAMAVSSSEKQISYQTQFNTIQSNQKLTDNDKVKQVVNLFFLMKAANYKDDTSDIDMSFFINSSNRFNKNKILNSLKLQKTLRQASNSIITSDNLTLTFGTINISGDSASVEVYENYSYQTKEVDQPSVNGITYEINLTNTNGKWLIISITSDDETYSDAMSSDTYSVDKVIQDGKAAEALDLSATISNSSTSTSASSTVSPLSTIIYYSYNRSHASAYAYTHTCNDGSTSTTTNYNLTQFPHYNPNDCMNFASQCIWAGFDGYDTYSGSYIPPMLYNWYSYRTSGASSSWISVGAFWSLVTLPQGSGTYLSTNNYSSGVAYAQPGDIIQIYSSSNGWYHTYVVYAVTGTTGSRTMSNIWVCAHTSNRRNVQLSTIWSGTTRTVSINGEYNYM